MDSLFSTPLNSILFLSISHAKIAGKECLKVSQSLAYLSLFVW
jgi:hypothetical protein